NKSFCYTVAYDGPGDTQLAQLAGSTTYDAATLEFDFVPDSSTIYINKYVFSSEEYNEFVGTGFNDVMAFYVNGVNCALIGGQPVSINTINGGNLNNGTPPSHPELYRDNTLGLYDTEMDGLTRVLTCAAPGKAGQVNQLKLAIADVGDATFDSSVFIAGGSLTTHHPKGPQANASVSQVVPGNPAGAGVTLDA